MTQEEGVTMESRLSFRFLDIVPSRGIVRYALCNVFEATAKRTTSKSSKKKRKCDVELRGEDRREWD